MENFRRSRVLFGARASGSVLHLVAAVPLACASTPGAGPHDMSASGHEVAARRQEQIADFHQRLYDPAAKENRQRCLPGRHDSVDEVCWNSSRNPTEEHQHEADRLRRAADEHRAASAVLREAEARACAGIAREDRDASPFTHVEDVASVQPIVLDSGDPTVSHRGPPVERQGEPAHSTERTVGVNILFRGVPGLTADKLRALVDCHVARNAALGHVVPEMPDCPLVPRGVEARVTTTPAGLQVEIRADDPSTAREVVARAGRLVTR